MIPEYYLKEDWIKMLDNNMRYAQKGLIERTLYAFELLTELTRLDQDFVFKGGTSLLLILPEMRRLSIDVDIVGTLEEDDLMNIPDESVFTEVEKDNRGERDLPTKHFKFKYESVVRNQEMPIILDILEIENEYETTENVGLESENPGLFELEDEVFVTVPNVENILADKLTAFAPETIGVPHYDGEGTSRSLEIAKQLFDVGELFDLAGDLSEVKQVYENIHGRESEYKDPSPNLDDSLRDTLETARRISLLNFDGYDHSEEMENIANSFEGIGQHLPNEKYTLREATVSAGKAAVLASLILTDKLDRFEEIDYSQRDEEIDADLTGKYDVLNDLRSINSEAYYHWSEAVRFLKESSLLR